MTFKETINIAFKGAMNLFNIITRQLRSIRLNRNLLVFLIFLAISVAFWFMQTLKENTTVSREYKVKIVGLPKSIIFTSDFPDKIKVNITGRGFDFLKYISRNEEHTVVVNFEDIEETASKLTIDNGILKRNLSKELGSSLKVQSITPAQIDVFYTKGQAKNIPIRFNSKSNVETGLQHVLCGIELMKDSALIYAPMHLHDSIKSITTERLNINVEDTTIVRVALRKIEGVKIVPDSIDVKICVDLFAEKTIPVPVYAENCSRNKTLKTFPRDVNVSFRVSATRYNAIHKEDFILIVDCNKIKPNDKNCQVELRDYPDGISHIKIKPENVEFVMEDNN